jgi:small subunit ribosomal protein S24e
LDDDHILNNTVANNYRISMDFEIKSDKRNELLSRREVKFTLKYDGATPSRMQIIGKICALLNVKEQQVVLDSLKSSFGKMEINGDVRIYDNEEGKKRTERAHLMERGMPKPKQEGAA